MIEPSGEQRSISRRAFVQRCALGAAALGSLPLLGCRSASVTSSVPGNRRAALTIPLEDGWLFGGALELAALDPGFNDAGWEKVSLPHCVARLGWQDWAPAAWEARWVYRRHFRLPPDAGKPRVFLHFDAVMVGAAPTINGQALPEHLGGYLPFHYEITESLSSGDNVLAVAVDSRWSNVPPEGAPVGPKRIDYLEPGGIYRGARLELVPPIFIRDVFAKPVRVLESDRRLEVTCSLDAATASDGQAQVQVRLRRENRTVAMATESIRIEQPGNHQVALTLSKLGNLRLWDVDHPHLYEVVTRLQIGGKTVDEYRTRIGFREARFELDGFFLNGKRLQLFGLNRHELFPYAGAAMPRRVLRRDAEMLRHEFNCNMVRCSHYPQSEAFLKACDELGLMVWEEVPGWGYLGDHAWKELLVRDVRDMIMRDRNHPSIIIWGTRVNESANDVELYRRTRALARSLDDSRPSSGSMTPSSRRTWKQTWDEDVFAFDDYHAAADGTVAIEPPVPGQPYLLAEAVGQFNYSKRKGFDSYYRRAGDPAVQAQQAIRHAEAHSKAAANPRICGVIAWCAFDYASLLNAYRGVKCPGVADVFRIPKLGAAFYQAQVDPAVRVVIEPAFYWDFGPNTPRGPGNRAAIFSNCDRLELFINGTAHAVLHPDLVNFPHLRYPPFFADLDLDGTGQPELRIDGFVSGRGRLSRSFSSDASHDRFTVTADTGELDGQEPDATRVVFRVVDRYGAPRGFAGGRVSFELSGPATLVGDNPFSLVESGGAGAVWIRSIPGSGGRVTLRAVHSQLGGRSVQIRVGKRPTI